MHLWHQYHKALQRVFRRCQPQFGSFDVRHRVHTMRELFRGSIRFGNICFCSPWLWYVLPVRRPHSILSNLRQSSIRRGAWCCGLFRIPYQSLLFALRDAPESSNYTSRYGYGTLMNYKRTSTRVRFYGMEYENTRIPWNRILQIEFHLYSMENILVELEFDRLRLHTKSRVARIFFS